VDTCCGGNLTLAESIEADGLDEDTLYGALDSALARVPDLEGHA
jgi:iron-sulfur cluster repair protein YtfE (RIC family)